MSVLMSVLVSVLVMSQFISVLIVSDVKCALTYCVCIYAIICVICLQWDHVM